jgi:hypothetical protein
MIRYYLPNPLRPKSDVLYPQPHAARRLLKSRDADEFFELAWTSTGRVLLQLDGPDGSPMPNRSTPVPADWVREPDIMRMDRSLAQTFDDLAKLGDVTAAGVRDQMLKLMAEGDYVRLVDDDGEINTYRMVSGRIIKAVL